jgi:hypothetical protein
MTTNNWEYYYDGSDVYHPLLLSLHPSLIGNGLTMVAMVPPLSHSNNEIKNIMLVNDEQDVLYNFKITLSEEGNVISFSKSKEAVKHLINSNNSSSYSDLTIIDIECQN